MEVQQRKFLDDVWKRYSRQQPDLSKLREKLLALGGEEMAPCLEHDLEKLLNRGIPVISPIIKLIAGRPISCHENSAAFWDGHKKTSELMTGWGLSADGLWRQHSWVRIIKSGVIVETTRPRTIYFGFVMTTEEADLFYEDNFSI